MIKGEIIAIKSSRNQAFTGVISFSAGSLNSRKTLEMPENTAFLGGVVADWLQNCVINLLSELYEYVYFECRREICGILCIDFSKRR